MDNIKIGNLIYNLRIENKLTQKQLADKIGVTDKAVSKWERGLGCPDVSLLCDISEIFNINIQQILSGDIHENSIVGGNMKKLKYYVCPICGNISFCTGESDIYCCSKKLKPCIPQKPDSDHNLKVENIEDDWFIESNHIMKKDHYISFIAFATGERLEIIKQYPEWNLQTRIPKRSHGTLLWYCTNHGFFYKNI